MRRAMRGEYVVQRPHIPADDDALMRVLARYGRRSGPRRDMAFTWLLVEAVRRGLVEVA